MFEGLIEELITRALLGEKTSIHAAQIIFALGIASIIYSKIYSKPNTLIMTITIALLIIAFIAFILSHEYLTKLINNALLSILNRSDKNGIPDIEEFLKLIKDILFRNRNIIDDILSNNMGNRKKLALFTCKLIAPSLSLFAIYVTTLLLILSIIKQQLNPTTMLNIGLLSIIIPIIISLITTAQGEPKLIRTSEGTPNLSTAIMNTANEVTKRYLYTNIKHYKKGLLPINALIRLLPIPKIEHIKLAHTLKFYLCECKPNNQKPEKQNKTTCNLEELINNWLQRKCEDKDEDDTCFEIIQPKASTISICNPPEKEDDKIKTVENVNILTISPREFLNIITGKDPEKGKPLIMRLTRKDKTTLAWIFAIPWHGCLIKMRPKKDKPIRIRANIVSIFMIGVAEYVTSLENELTLYARQVTEAALLCEEENPQQHQQ